SPTRSPDTGSGTGSSDAVLVPSRSNGYATPVQEPRRAETEVVAGRQVHVIYRPSRGFEVRDN
ncbi:hypothetical protein, partial [Lentzea indica]|uniref:hypothetical protein n=1 Tax=Lentzea indica TaxID=2604800 RepID=UPI001FE67A5A